MKYIKLYDNIDWDWDEEEHESINFLYVKFNDSYETYIATYYPLKGQGKVTLFDNYKYNNNEYGLKPLTDDEIIDLKNDKYIIQLFINTWTNMKYSKLIKKYPQFKI